MSQKVVKVIHRSKPWSAFDHGKLVAHLTALAKNLNLEYINLSYIVEQVYRGLPETITSKELVDLTAETLASLTTQYYQYSYLAARVLEAYLQKTLPLKFSDNAKILYEFKNNSGTGKRLISGNVYNIIRENSHLIDTAIQPQRDFDIDYFGFRTLEKSYILKTSNGIQETPQFLFMRVALGIHLDNIELAIETYHLMSQKYFIHASPTLFNAGTDFPNLSSCFLLAMNDDSIDGIFKTVHETAMISKSAGGIGLHVSNIRSQGSYIAGTNGTSSGLVPMLRVFNNTAKYVDQGGNKRPGAFCIYLEPWHSDIFEFLELRKNHGKEELKARDLFYALWIPDLFMEKVKKGEEWCLFSENIHKGLSDAYGDEFKALYDRYEQNGDYVRKVDAQKLWHAILVAQTETGNPFLLYKDACNKKSNQKNLGTIKSSNLCCEIVQYSSPNEIAVCNIASLALPTFLGDKGFDFIKLHEVCKVLVRNLNKIIDVTDYPLEKCERSNLKHRPIGVGVQGLADLFFLLKISFGSPESKILNVQIFETIYHAALEASCELSQIEGKYESYKGSPISEGILQYDMWDVTPTDLWDWKTLKLKIREFGVHNSLLVALMPTASTSQIFGYTECFEPITSNIYSRRVLSGEHQVVNKYLIDDLVSLGLWSDSIKNKIILNDGSIQSIPSIPAHLKEIYKTVWEMSQKIIIDMAADRSPFIDQSQSMNLFMKDVTMSKLTSMHFYAWRKGLKTGMYYLRTKAASSAIKFTIDISQNETNKRKIDIEQSDHEVDKKMRIISENTTDTEEYNIFDNKIISCSLQDPEGCESCSA
ncbi:hypothetical protein DAMA08_030260 [Martiniozyma asiatica (nom. inval.)]|nr:hypothetical protein DAMA08_030260 [Martiniozyma asiatica]